MKRINLLDETWKCECGKKHELGYPYVAAHWGESLIHTCTTCGAKHLIRNGWLKLEKKGKSKGGKTSS